MVSSDDKANSRSPFHGDESGDIFAMENTSPKINSNEIRSIETQSGFELILKKIKNKTMFLVKRKIGTPPASQIILTPDEANCFAQILATNDKVNPSGEPNETNNLNYTDFDEFSLENYRSSRNRKSTKKFKTPLKIIGIIVLAKILILIGLFFGGISHFGQPHKNQKVTADLILNDEDYIKNFITQFIINFYECKNYNLPFTKVILTLANLNPALGNDYFQDIQPNSNKNSIPNNLILNVQNISLGKIQNKSRDISLTFVVKSVNSTNNYNVKLTISCSKNAIGIPQIVVEKIEPIFIKF